MKPVIIDGNWLSIEELVRAVRFGAPVELSENAAEQINASRKVVEDIVASDKVVYGMNTGYGKFENVSIAKEDLDELQLRLILSDCCGVGEPFAVECVRAMMLVRINVLSKGYSGVRLSTVQTLVDMLNKGVTPVVPEKGSVGASGDLCPLAHMVMPLIGMGEAEYEGKVMPGAEAMAKAGIRTVQLVSREGLGLINGTSAMTGVAALAAYDAAYLIKTADIVSALTVEALTGIVDSYDERLHKARIHSGQVDSAENMRRLLKDSKMASRAGELRVQDAYSIRCIPQVHGGIRLAYDYARKVVEDEINAVADNPLTFTESGDIVSGGNFHGEAIAIAMDTLGIAMSEIGGIAERRIARLVDPALNNGLPAFIIADGGLNCGYMIPHYAAAALASENKILAHPASVDSIPTSAGQEDHVSFGTVGARKARQIIDHSFHIISIEWICAAQGADIRGSASERLGEGGRIAYGFLREQVPYCTKDYAFYTDMNKAFEMAACGELVRRVEDKLGALK